MLSRVAETDLEGSKRCLIEVLSRGLPEEGNHEHSRASVPAKIRTWHLPNTSLQLHRYIQFLGISVTVGHFKEDKNLSHTFVSGAKFMLCSVYVTC
jgi:hypothetical protein